MVTGGPLYNRGKRPHDYVTKSPGDESHHPPFAKVVHSSRHEPPSSSKSAVKPRSKATKLSSTKAANSVGVVVSRHATQAASLLYPFSPNDPSRLFIYTAGWDHTWFSLTSVFIVLVPLVLSMPSLQHPRRRKKEWPLRPSTLPFQDGWFISRTSQKMRPRRKSQTWLGLLARSTTWSSYPALENRATLMKGKRFWFKSIAIAQQSHCCIRVS